MLPGVQNLDANHFKLISKKYREKKIQMNCVSHTAAENIIIIKQYKDGHHLKKSLRIAVVKDCLKIKEMIFFLCWDPIFVYSCNNNNYYDNF